MSILVSLSETLLVCDRFCEKERGTKREGKKRRGRKV
jgi:hypothetical protein